jgi:hypothetical protein
MTILANKVKSTGLAAIFHSVALLGFAALSFDASAQDAPSIPIASAQQYFREAHSLCSADHGKLWGVSLCGPIMFVDPATRTIVANQADAKGALASDAGAFTGTLPADQTISNTAVEWSGERWTQIAWPLPKEDWRRKTLIAHELFHRIQNQLPIPKSTISDNAQLDTLDGRYYLQLEWRALARALQAPTAFEQKQAAGDAIAFRAERYRLFPGAEAEEDALEMNEGLAEFTGVMVGNSGAKAQRQSALADLSDHVADATFVRSFAYATGPAYGMLLDRHAKGWRGRLKTDGSFYRLLRQALHIATPATVQPIAARYDGDALRAAEMERETKRAQRIAAYQAKLVDGPILTLKFLNMHVQFDPRNLQPLGALGTVYPTLRVFDDWGSLEAKNGALMLRDWSAVMIAAPAVSSGSNLTGDGWKIELKPGWKLVPGARDGDFVLAEGS